jgi:hypothetical protein
MDTEGEGNATDAILKTMGEIRVEVFDCGIEKKWLPAYDPDACQATFLGEAVSVKEGKHKLVMFVSGCKLFCQWHAHCLY